MKVIRRGVFETNSSSMHSLSIVNKDSETFVKKRYIVIPGEYHWEGPTLKTPEDKMSYLLALISSNNGLPFLADEEDVHLSINEFLNLPDVLDIINVVQSTGAQIIIKIGTSGFGEVDHQSVMGMYEFLGDIPLKDFIFNDKYQVIIDHDNH